MRIAIVSAARSAAQKKGMLEYVEALAKGMTSMGHRVDIVDAWTEDGMRLPGYEYIAVVTEPLSAFSGKIPSVAAKMLSTGSSLSGKKSAAFIKKSGLFSSRALSNIMKTMEAEGMFINWSEFLLNAPHAEALGKHIGA